MKASEAQSVLQSVLDAAKRASADAADAVLYHAVSSGVSYRLGNLEDVERSEGLDLGVRLMFGRRQASVSTTDISKAKLAALVERCAAMAKAAPEDPYVGLAPADRLAKPPFPDLDLGDYAEPATETLKERARACEEAALAVEGVVNSSGAGASYGEGRKWFATSHGFFGESGGSHHSISVSVIAEDANGMERDYDYASALHAGDLDSDCGSKARSAADHRHRQPRIADSRCWQQALGRDEQGDRGSDQDGAGRRPAKRRQCRRPHRRPDPR